MPRRLASGAKISRVSREIRFCFSGARCSRVRMLWSRSASFTTITRISLAIAKNIRRKFSACCSVLLENSNLDNLVTPSTNVRTSVPKRSSSSSRVTGVSSTTSCKNPAAITALLPPRFLRIPATATG